MDWLAFCEVGEVTDVVAATPVLDGDTRVDWLGRFEVGKVTELATATPVLDENDPLVD